jgi:hypothetical protein
MEDVGSMENTSGKLRDQSSDGKSRLSHPLDTVSLLEIGLHSLMTLQRYQGIARSFLDSYSFLPEKHPLTALKTNPFAGLFAFNLPRTHFSSLFPGCSIPITSRESRSCSTMAFRVQQLSQGRDRENRPGYGEEKLGKDMHHAQ